MSYTPSTTSPTMTFLDWDEDAVASWLEGLGYGQYREQIIDQGISGDVLALLDSSSLTDLGISSLGHRLAILKAVYGLKLDFGRGQRDLDDERRGTEGMRDTNGDDRGGGDGTGWDWGEEDWRPVGEEPHPSQSPTITQTQSRPFDGHNGRDAGQARGGGEDTAVSRLWEAIRDQNDRMAVLEREYRKLLDVIDMRREERDNIHLSPNIRQRANSSTSSSDGQLESFSTSANAGFGLRGTEFPKPRARERQRQETVKADFTSGGSGSGPGSRWSEETASTVVGGREAQEMLIDPQKPVRSVRKPPSNRPSLVHSPEQNVLSPSFHSDPPMNPSTSTAPASMAKGIASKVVLATPPPLVRMMSSSGIVETPTTLGSGPAQQQSGSTSIAQETPSRGSSVTASANTPAHIGDISASSLLGREIPSSLPVRSGLSRSDSIATTTPDNGANTSVTSTNPLSRSTKDAPAHPQKSLRTNMDDPCWKVLPAALKKYKIYDDWKQYAMFICYEKTERCLSYDEKPLLLFQKLKEANQKPVFMLRHIRDIKSPIEIAQQKQSQRSKHREPSSAGKETLATPHSSSSKAPSTGSAAITPSSGAKPSANPHPYSKDTRLHRPPVLQPISAKAKAITAGGTLDSGKSTPSSGNGNFPDLPSPGLREVAEEIDGDRKLTYVVAIYPYTSEREDEFGVVVGTTFIVLNKIKGWWVVQRDADGTGAVTPDINKSGWVPAGCLLETSRPIGPASKTDDSGRPSLACQPIPPGSILSSSFQGIVLMDHEKKRDDELQLQRNDMLKVFKRYAHWSYAIKESTGERGWVPSWFVGKISSSGADKMDKSSGSILSPEKANEGSSEGKSA